MSAVMVKVRFIQTVLALYLLLASAISHAVNNPDQITVYFPAFQGPEHLGLNVSTVLSLQLAQTTRRMPWPNNPDKHDFGEGIIRWSAEPLDSYAVQGLVEAAQRKNLLAQIVVAGTVRRFAGNFVVELDVVLPEYKVAPSMNCASLADTKCDYRTKNFEVWKIGTGSEKIEVGLPKRYFSISSIVLKPDVVNRYKAASGLTIRESLNGGKVLGETGDRLRFVEFNKSMPGAPTKVISGNIQGYVTLPELSDAVSEFSDMVGGILQLFRGDWQWAISSFTQVLENPNTRIPLRVDALLYRGMARFQNGGNGLDDITTAASLAPYDVTVTKYLAMALIANGINSDQIKQMLHDKALLFARDDDWYNKVHRYLNHLL